MADAAFREFVRTLLVNLARFEDEEVRVALLGRVVRKLGDLHYPLFIKLLSVVGQSGDWAAKALLARTLAAAILRGDSPCGSLSSWGTQHAWAAVPGLRESSFRAGARRKLDPFAYLCAWYSQGTDRGPLRDELYRETLENLLRLFEANGEAARICQAKLVSDAEDPQAGTFSSATRSRIGAIARAWSAGVAPGEIARDMLRHDRSEISGTGFRKDLILIQSR